MLQGGDILFGGEMFLNSSLLILEKTRRTPFFLKKNRYSLFRTAQTCLPDFEIFFLRKRTPSWTMSGDPLTVLLFSHALLRHIKPFSSMHSSYARFFFARVVVPVGQDCFLQRA